MKGGCQARHQWEDKLFGGHYNHAKPFERCKYGVLNIHNDPNGVASCAGYGLSFMVLKEVRLRTTFVSMDSAGIAGQKDVD